MRRSLSSGIGAAGLAAAACLFALPPNLVQAQHEWMGVINLNKLHQHATGFGVEIGQFEDGTARWTHGALQGVRTFQRSIPGPNANENHATMVAGLLAGRQTVAGGAFKGAAPSATIQASHWVNPGGGASWEDDFLVGMRWFLLAPRTPDVIHMSASSRFNDPVAERTRVQQVGDWMAADRLFVTTAGNLGANGASTLGSPGTGYNTLTVGATEGANYQQIAPYSGIGPAILGGGSRMKPDLVAPGTNITSTTSAGDNTYGANSGTSFAAPQVSGVAASLYEFGNAHNLSRDPRVLRAVLMNSTTKSVRSGPGVETRWDRTAGLGKGANSISSILGTGQLDAGQAWEQYRAGQHTVPQGGIGEVPELGFDLNTIGGAGLLAGNAYRTNKEVRRGSYMTSTLASNRDVTSGYDEMTSTNDWANWSYAALNNFDIAISKLGAIETIIQQSNNTDSTTEHSVYKAAERTKYYTNVFMPAAPQGNATYGLAWEWFPAPTYTKEFNGTFSGTRGHYLDNGWYIPDIENPPAPTISKPTWAPVNSNDAWWALRVGSSEEAAQEVWNPLDTFTISFNYGFSGMNGTSFFAYLGSINLFEAAGIAGGQITPDGTNTGIYKHLTLTIGRDLLQALTDQFVELKFGAIGGPDFVFIDDVVFVPPPASVLLAFAGVGALGLRRRRAA